jgi:hypothetical protein
MIPATNFMFSIYSTDDYVAFRPIFAGETPISELILFFKLAVTFALITGGIS